MEDIKLAEVESRFVELIWEKEPISSGELVTLCEKELDWKKSTTYTVLRRLCQKGILQNQDAVVTSLIKKDEYMALRSEQMLADEFDGSLPQFVAAFMSRKKLSKKQISEIQKLIDEYEEYDNRATAGRRNFGKRLVNYPEERGFEIWQNGYLHYNYKSASL